MSRRPVPVGDIASLALAVVVFFVLTLAWLYGRTGY